MSVGWVDSTVGRGLLYTPDEPRATLQAGSFIGLYTGHLLSPSSNDPSPPSDYAIRYIEGQFDAVHHFVVDAATCGAELVSLP